jgi:hypothetical protein
MNALMSRRTLSERHSSLAEATRVAASAWIRFSPRKGDPTDMLRRVLTEVRAFLARRADTRAARPHLAMLGVPLAITASVLSQPLCVPPLAACAWWWAPRRTGWEWIGALARGAIGAEWALVGSGALAAYPGHRAAVAIAWIASTALVGLFGYGGFGQSHQPALLPPARPRPGFRLRPVVVPSIRRRFAAHVASGVARGRSRRKNGR